MNKTINLLIIRILLLFMTFTVFSCIVQNPKLEDCVIETIKVVRITEGLAYDIIFHDVIGGGASGGLGVGAFAFLNGEIISGIEFIKSLSHFDAKSKNADWIITGEGKLDTQTLSGKVIYGVSQTAIRQQIKVAAFCGISELSKTALNDLGITYVDAIMNRTNDNQMAMKKSYDFVREMAVDFARSIIS